MAEDPGRHASTTDPDTWSNYETALATVQAGQADGLTYMLTTEDPYAAVDLDDCRNDDHSLDNWAQQFLARGRAGYVEVTPSGRGIRVWGAAAGDGLNRKFSLEIDGKPAAAELFRGTNKALTITGLQIDGAHELGNIDKLMDWAVKWGERHKAAARASAAGNGKGFDHSGGPYSIDEIDEIVRNGAPDGANRSDVFHSVIGHFVGCGWDAEKILELLEQHPHGIAERYHSQGRLRAEVERSTSNSPRRSCRRPATVRGPMLGMRQSRSRRLIRSSRMTIRPRWMIHRRQTRIRRASGLGYSFTAIKTGNHADPG